jgi:hypothetical protein
MSFANVSVGGPKQLIELTQNQPHAHHSLETGRYAGTDEVRQEIG